MADYIFGDAFMLMTYFCSCGHREVIWNSRDGITPFAMGCPSCGEPTLQHIHWSSDVRAPNHVPHHGQGVWRDGTVEDAVAIMTKRLDGCIGTKYEVGAERRADLIGMVRRGEAEEFQKGWPMFERAGGQQ
jgi:hypothetical protein